MKHDEPIWLVWARELLAHAQCGLTFSRDPFDRERYERIRELSVEMFHLHTGEAVERITTLFVEQTGYATPKIDVRAAVFDEQSRMLMVRETADQGRWTLPGGWADVNATPAENAVKEVREESGYDVAAVKLAAVWERARQGQSPGVFSCYTMFFVCRHVGGTASTGIETSEVKWFAKQDLPDDLSLERVLPGQIRIMFDHWHQPDLPTSFD